MRKKLKDLTKRLTEGLVEREEIMKISLLTMLAQENIILIGPPGTAKSEISRRLSQVIKDGDYFEYLLTKFTTPEEIFGPLSISELKQDKFKRKTAGYMPTVHVAFLDEIFKANSSILNSLLTIINEKTFHNGSVKEKTPLQSLISASNELPIGDDELGALYDRFLVRKEVGYIDDSNIDGLFDLSGEEFLLEENLKLGVEDFEQIKRESRDVKISEDIRERIKKIRIELKNEFKENDDEDFTDRRFVKIVNFLKVAAYTNGRNDVDRSDLIILKDCLWNHPENREKVEAIVKKVVGKDNEYLKRGKSKVVSGENLGNLIFIPAGKTSVENGGIEIKRSIYLNKYEVTQKEFEDVMGYNNSNFKGANRPVEMVMWIEGVMYCNKLSKKEGLDLYYDIDMKYSEDYYKEHGYGVIELGDIHRNEEANGYRLPKELEWKYAARGGVHGKPSKYAGSDNIEDVAWYKENSGKETKEVGKKKPNEYGLYDMSGNVWEWCDDGKENASRAVCGGSWRNSVDYCEVGFENSCSPDVSGDSIGFRVCRSVE